jgi:hypothetical protein
MAVLREAFNSGSKAQEKNAIQWLSVSVPLMLLTSALLCRLYPSVLQQIRVIIERLVRRCGVEPVAAACPAGDVKLMTHIRKQQARKERRRGGSEAGSQVGGWDLILTLQSYTILHAGLCVMVQRTEQQYDSTIIPLHCGGLQA